MNVTDAVHRRKSTRAFLNDPVPEAIVRDLVTTSQRAPSGGNLQPWHVHAIAGAVRDAFVDRVAARIAADQWETPEYTVYPPKLWEPLRTRRRNAGAQRYDAIGVSREENGLMLLEQRNVHFFGAPVGLFFCLDRRAGPPQWSDVGMYMQTFMLLAVERGLATCPQEYWANWPKTIAEFLRLPDNLMVFAGMSLGYADPSAPLNAFRTDRAPPDEFATLRGFT